MKIVIITDGNNILGLGHVYQSLTLANALRDKLGEGLSLTFITKSDMRICDFIHSFGYDVERFDNDDQIFDNLNSKQPSRIIFDKLDVSTSLVVRIKKKIKAKLIIFTNLTAANDYADVAVLADFGSGLKNIVNRDKDTGRVKFFGLKYWVLRPEFYVFKKQPKAQLDNVKNIMLIFGGSDPANMSTFVLKTLLQIDFEFNILLVLGAAFEHKEELNSVVRENRTAKSKIKIVKNIANVAEMMRENDVVFASPGLSFSEALAVGTPLIGFHQSELQRKEYADILPTMGLEDLHNLPMKIKNKDFIYPNHPTIQAMEIGEGKDEIINEILN